MDIQSVDLWRVRLPLIAPFRTSFGTQHDRDILLVRVTTPHAEGWGECVAMRDPFYSAEWVDGAQLIIEQYLLPWLFEAGSVQASDLAGLWSPVIGHRMAKAAVELAVLDAGLREQKRSLAEEFGAVRRAVDCGVSVGIMDSIPELVQAVGNHLDAGYRRIKIKIEPGWDVEPVTALRQSFGDIPLQVDANAAYHLSDADHLARLDDFGLLMIEQPLPEDHVRSHALLAQRLQTPICLDESITSAQSCVDAISMGATQIVNVKAGRVGGYLEARRIADVCEDSGVPVWCGGMVETGIGRAANVALAAGPGFVLPGDVSASRRFWARDIITEPFVMVDGRLEVPSGPGLGVEIDLGFVQEIATSHRTLTAGDTTT